MKDLTILPGKNYVFLNIQYKDGCLAASDLFHMLTQSIKFHIYSIITYKGGQKGPGVGAKWSPYGVKFRGHT